MDASALFFHNNLMAFGFQVKLIWMTPNLLLELSKYSVEKIRSLGIDYTAHIVTAGTVFNAENTRALVNKIGVKAIR